MRVGGEAFAVDLLAEVQDLLLRETTLEEGAGIDARRGVALHIDQVAAMVLRGRVPEMHETHVVERGRRLKACDMPAELGALPVGFENDHGRIPADRRANAILDLAVARL